MKKNKILLLIGFGFILLSGGIYFYQEKNSERMEQFQKEEKIKEIESHFSPFVKVDNKTPFYGKENGNYIEKGTFEKDAILYLKEEKIEENTKYFLVINFEEEYYVPYESVSPSEEKRKEKRYQNYLPFNESIITKEITKFYQNGKLVYTFYCSFEFPIYRKENDSYYVEFENQLFYILKEDVQDVIKKENTTEEKTDKIATIAYHFIYNPDKGQKCDQIICHTFEQVTSHIHYLQENHYVTLTMEEFELWIDGKINLPKNSILITVDDGWYGDDASFIFTENKINATIFVVSSWYNPKAFETEYVEVHSHSDNLHNINACLNQGLQGGGILCLPKETLLNDLKLSREKTNMTTVFAYPFYDVNDYAIEVLKEAGFTMAFIGFDQNNSYYMKQHGNKYRIPRLTILSDTKASDLESLLSN